MQNVHDRYAQGVDLFPKFRLKVQPEDLPKRSRHAAGLLVRAWDRIDEDRAYFDATLSALAEVGSGLTVVRVGRNAVKTGFLASEDAELAVDVMPIGEFHELYDGQEFVLKGGRTASYTDGRLQQSESDFTIARGSNVNQIMLSEQAIDRLAASSAL
jgi:hypothetical protein